MQTKANENQELSHLHGKLYAAVSYDEIVCALTNGHCNLLIGGLVGQKWNEFVIPIQERLHFCLEEIHQFDSKLVCLTKNQSVVKLIAFLARNQIQKLPQLFLLGCHLIMSHGLSFEETLLALRPARDPEAAALNSVLDNALRSVCCAKCLNWIEFNVDAPNEPRLQMDEYNHYSRFGIPFNLHHFRNEMTRSPFSWQQPKRLRLHHRP